MLPTRLIITLGLAVAWALPAAAQSSAQLDSATLAGFRWRSIGPSNMGGRVTDVEGIGFPSKTFYVVGATSGVWKTTNNGTTFFPIFDTQKVASMGDLAIAPSDSNILYLGTGEEDSRNSISPGQGIYKSTNGGLSWQLMGLEKTEVIGRIVVHPTNPNIVWVAALGAIWRSNPERGLYKTTDGGRNWRLVKSISDKAGFVDIAINPRNPNILFAASWERVRRPYALFSGGSGSGLWRSGDGGETWTEVQGGGFPAGMKGRIGIAIAPSNPQVIYTIVEAAAPEAGNAGLEGSPEMSPCGGGGRGGGAAGPTRCHNGLYRSQDGGRTWTWMSTPNTRPFYYSQVRVDPRNPNRVYWSSTPVRVSDDGGKTVYTTAEGVHVDTHAWWIDPGDPEHIVIGHDGGAAQTFDRGGNYEDLRLMEMGQFYNISFDMAVPYNVCGGLQDNGSWCGPSRKRSGSLVFADWNHIRGADGFVTQQDPTNPNIVYAEGQGGGMSRIDLATGASANLRGSMVGGQGIRWNWNTPFILSSHNPSVFYAGANRLFKSLRRGDNMFPISPDLSRGDTMKIRVSTTNTGGVTRDVTQAETYGTIVSIAESPVKPGLLFAGTDDGNVWMTGNDGGNWTNLSRRFPGLPEWSYVTRIEPSSHDSATVYVTFSNHRNGDFNPYVYASTDFGATFRSIASNLPVSDRLGFLHVIREDPVNPDLLYLGAETGIWISLNRGGSWQHFNNNLPTVPVHDLKIHPRDRELIAGTHGRSIWVVDVAPLQQMNDSVITRNAHLFASKPAFMYTQPRTGGLSQNGNAQAYYTAQNAPYGAEISYRLSRPVTGGARLIVLGAGGDTVANLTGPGEAGLHKIVWGFTSGGGGGGGRGGGRGGGGGGAAQVVPGYPPGFNPRPAEGPPQDNVAPPVAGAAGQPPAAPPGGRAGAAGPPGRGGGAGAAGAGGAGAGGGPGGRGGGGGPGGGGPPGFGPVTEGQYTIVLEVGGQRQTQRLRVFDVGASGNVSWILHDGR